MSSRLVVSRLALVLALLAVPAQAQSPEQVAGKSMKAAVKLALAEVKASFKAATSAFDDELEVFVDSALNTSDPAGALEVLTEAWGVAHAAMLQAVAQQTSNLLDAAVFALLEYQTAVRGDFGGPYPDAFLPGAGASLDVFIAGWRKELARAEAKLSLRLGKLRKKLAAGGRDFLVCTRPMVLESAHAVNADSGIGQTSTSTTQALEIQLVASLGIVGGAGQPAVGVAGGGMAFSTTHIVITAGGLDTVDEDVTADNRGQWQYVAPALHVGNYTLTVGQQNDLQVARAPLGAR